MGVASYIELAAALVAIIAAALAGMAWLARRARREKNREKLEEYLRDEKELGFDQGQRTVIHLMANLGLSESEVLDAAFQSEAVRRVTSVDDSGRAGVLMFEYDAPNELDRRKDRGRSF